MIGIGIGINRSRSAPAAAVDPVVPTVGSAPVLWLRADKGVTLNGSTVSAWADQSGNANHATQGTAAAQPLFTATDANLNNRPTMTPDGGDTMLTPNIDLRTAYTCFTVIRFGTLKNWDGVFRHVLGADTAGGTTGFAVYSNSSGSIVWGGGVAGSTYYGQSPGGYIVANTAYVLTMRCSGTAASRSFRKNGVDNFATWTKVNDGSFLMPAAAYPVSLFGGWSSATALSRLAGSNPEVIVYNTALSDANCLLVERYLGTRYGITVA